MAVFTTPLPNQLAATAKPRTICLDGDADVGADSSVSPNNTDTDGVEDLEMRRSGNSDLDVDEACFGRFAF